MGMNQKSGMDRSAVIRIMVREYLRKVPDPYLFVRVHYNKQIVLIFPSRLAIISPPAIIAAKIVTTACRGSRKKK